MSKSLRDVAKFYVGGGFHAAIAEDVCKGKEYQNVCKVCGERSEVFGASIFAHCLANGWPYHCGQQMFLEIVTTTKKTEGRDPR